MVLGYMIQKCTDRIVYSVGEAGLRKLEDAVRHVADAVTRLF